MFPRIPFPAWLRGSEPHKEHFVRYLEGRKEAVAYCFYTWKVRAGHKTPLQCTHIAVICWLTLLAWDNIWPTSPARFSPSASLRPGPGSYLAPWLRASASPARHILSSKLEAQRLWENDSNSESIFVGSSLFSQVPVDPHISLFIFIIPLSARAWDWHVHCLISFHSCKVKAL